MLCSVGNTNDSRLPNSLYLCTVLSTGVQEKRAEKHLPVRRRKGNQFTRPYAPSDAIRCREATHGCKDEAEIGATKDLRSSAHTTSVMTGFSVSQRKAIKLKEKADETLENTPINPWPKAKAHTFVSSVEGILLDVIDAGLASFSSEWSKTGPMRR